MEQKIYSITLADGTQLTNLTLNGNNFISKEEITNNTFEGKLNKITISSIDEDIIWYNVEVIQILNKNDEWWFILQEVPQEKMLLEQIIANIDYIAMETGVELEV